MTVPSDADCQWLQWMCVISPRLAEVNAVASSYAKLQLSTEQGHMLSCVT